MLISDWSSDVCSSDLDDALEVRLQSPAWLVPAVTNWRPAGNSTWVDSTANDFERNSNLPYDLMVTNVSQASDITQITLAKPGNDKLCVADLSLRVNNPLPYTQTYGKTAARKSVVEGKSVSVRVSHGGRRNIKKKNE